MFTCMFTWCREVLLQSRHYLVVLIPFLIFTITIQPSNVFAKIHGYVPHDVNLLSKLKINISKTNDVKRLLGDPMFKNIVPADDTKTWYYVQADTKSRPFVGNVTKDAKTLKLVFGKDNNILKHVFRIPAYRNIAGITNHNKTEKPEINKKIDALINPREVLEIHDIKKHYDINAVNQWKKTVDDFNEKNQKNRKLKKIDQKTESAKNDSIVKKARWNKFSSGSFGLGVSNLIFNAIDSYSDYWGDWDKKHTTRHWGRRSSGYKSWYSNLDDDWSSRRRRRHSGSFTSWSRDNNQRNNRRYGSGWGWFDNLKQWFRKSWSNTPGLSWSSYDTQNKDSDSFGFSVQYRW